MAARPPVFDHVLIIMFENQYREYVMANDYFRDLASRGVDLVNAFGVMHPSQTNYIASTAGELCNVTDDDRPEPLSQQCIVDLLEAAGVTWKAYMDGYVPALAPWSADLVPADQYPYVIKHDPFSSFASVIGSEERWAKIVDEKQLWVDLVTGTLPQYAWFTPDMWNDGHYTRGTHTEPTERAPALVDQAAGWLEWFFGTLEFPGPDSLLPPRTLVVVTFDEADFEAAWDEGKKYTYDGPNQVYTVLLGDVAPSAEAGGYNHYAVLRTVEENFGLGTLGKNDADSTWLRFLWGERFAWSDPEETPIVTSGPLAAAGYDGFLVAVYGGDGGELAWRYWQGAWSDPEPVGAAAFSAVALAAGDDGLTLVFDDGDGRLLASTFAGGWSDPAPVAEGVEGDFALSPCNRGADLMLAYRDAGGAIWSRRRDASGWGEPVDTGHATDGHLTLAALGHTLLLVLEGDDGTLQAVSYNTAPWNVTDIKPGTYSGPYDNAVADRWSPSAHEVAHFAAAASPVTPGEREPDLQPYRAGGPLAAAHLDGVIHLAHRSADAPQVVTEQFSIAGILTPALPVSYRAADATTTSNGYGTLAEAGWTAQEPIPGAEADGVVAAGATDEAAFLLFGEAGGPVRMTVGAYGPG